MAKKRDKPQNDGSARSESVRAAAAQAVAAAAGQAQLTRERAQELADELAGAAQKVRDALEGVRPTTGDDLRDIRARLDALEARVAALETRPPARTRSSTARRAKGGGTAGS